MVTLGVNIDHVATVRQARRAQEPDPVWAAVEATLGGADGITFHLREDRRHIIDRDARVLKETVAIKLNMEMAAAEEVVAIAEELSPDQCTLVPERREELTTEGGLDVARTADRVRAVRERLAARGVVLSAFIEPIADQVKASVDCGMHAIELWTGGYANAKAPADRAQRLKELRTALDLGRELGLEVHAGHGLDYHNVAAPAAVPGFSEFNIGHAIVARSIFVGMREAVREMKALLVRHAPKGGS